MRRFCDSVYDCFPSQVTKSRSPFGAPDMQLPVTTTPGCGSRPHQAEVTLFSTGFVRMLSRTATLCVLPAEEPAPPLTMMLHWFALSTTLLAIVVFSESGHSWM